MTKLRVGAVVLVPLLISGTSYADGVDGRIGTILRADEIDRSRVKAGTFAVVVHGLGERNRVSGRWVILETTRGYVQTIDADTLTLGVGRGSQPAPIALERIRTMVLIGAPARKTQSLSPRAQKRESTEACCGVTPASAPTVPKAAVSWSACSRCAIPCASNSAMSSTISGKPVTRSCLRSRRPRCCLQTNPPLANFKAATIPLPASSCQGTERLPYIVWLGRK